ncbi:MAG: peptidylprolyl isomerase, partial [Candidatus Cloacimonadia bacterium]
IRSGRDIYFDCAVDDYFENYIKNKDIFRVNVSYVKFNENLLRFPITIPADSIKIYYEEHIEEFITVRDTLPLEKVSNEIEEILYKKKEEELKDSLITEVYSSIKQNNFQLPLPAGASIVQNVTFIKNMPYYEAHFSLLKDKIFAVEPDSAFIIRETPDVIIGRVNSKNRFRSGELISLKPLIKVLLTERWDRQWYSKFYELHAANKDSYTTPDTLQLRCIFIRQPVDTAKINIPMSDAINYFYKNRIQYTLPYSVKLETIFLENSPQIESQIQTIQKALSPPYNTDFSLLAQLFFTPTELTLKNGEWIAFSQLDKSIQAVLDTMRQGNVSPPIFVNSGCYIIKMVGKKAEHLPDFQEVSSQVVSDLKFQIADSIAQKRALAILDSVSSISQLLGSEDDTYSFRTPYITLESGKRILHLTNQENPQAPTYTLTLNEEEFSLLTQARRGRIIPKIFPLLDSNPERYPLKRDYREGYIILFVEDKIPRKKVSGYESYAYAREDFSRIMQYEASREFTAYLKEEVKENGKNTILIAIFGGLKDTGWLSLSDASEESNILDLVIRDAMERAPGAYSHPVRLTDYGFGFYHIVDKKIPSRKDFMEEKERFREEYVNAQFNKWFENYKKENRVEILINL